MVAPRDLVVNVLFSGPSLSQAAVVRQIPQLYPRSSPFAGLQVCQGRFFFFCLLRFVRLLLLLLLLESMLCVAAGASRQSRCFSIFLLGETRRSIFTVKTGSICCVQQAAVVCFRLQQVQFYVSSVVCFSRWRRGTISMVFWSSLEFLLLSSRSAFCSARLSFFFLCEPVKMCTQKPNAAFCRFSSPPQ